ncbi:hypothetical protein PN465_11425 [Nodularia spumigena CS-584]|uniref:hypothetical protein n=1 Tax=Nodularia spumigena TaxID=70799 RepID=UPI0018DB810E|nr:hypothetical protein [Nodularia spumigena]MDB9382826.1 hypothetical protein [Nodularia spumigena CS-584]MEA5527533.1 hypothetical protein [Nodularia spumigena UHCC 0143]
MMLLVLSDKPSRYMLARAASAVSRRILAADIASSRCPKAVRVNSSKILTSLNQLGQV